MFLMTSHHCSSKDVVSDLFLPLHVRDDRQVGLHKQPDEAGGVVKVGNVDPVVKVTELHPVHGGLGVLRKLCVRIVLMP
jgi:hypothetical protein